MKKVYFLFVLFLALPLGISAGKGGKIQPPGPALNVSPAVCVSGQTVTFSGSGYKPDKDVDIVMGGPGFQPTISTVTDANGNFQIDAAVGGTSGYYIVNSYQYLGSRATLAAAASLEIEY
jgi:hypothetical protein